MIEKWTQDQALILLAVGLAVVLIELSALLSTFLACSKISTKKKTQASTFTSTQTLSPFSETDQEYGKSYFHCLFRSHFFPAVYNAFRIVS